MLTITTEFGTVTTGIDDGRIVFEPIVITSILGEMYIEVIVDGKVVGINDVAGVTDVGIFTIVTDGGIV
jgi:hypothetical protein